MLKILGKPTSINVRKVLWTCVELGIDFELAPYGSGFASCNTPEFIALNPNAMVPVIQDGDFVLWESNAICRYLAAKHGRADLLPVQPQQRARVEQWMDWQATELNNSWRYAFMALVRQSPAHQDKAAIEAGVQAWNHHLSILDRQLSRTGAHAVGEVFTLADIVLGLSVHRWMVAPIERLRLPCVAAYYERLSERVGYQVHGRNGMP